MDQSNSQFNQFKTTNNRSKKPLFIGLAVIITATLLALAGWKWHGQIADKNQNLASADKQINELMSKISELEEDLEVITLGGEQLSLKEWDVHINLGPTDTHFIHAGFKDQKTTDNPGGSFYSIVARDAVTGCAGDVPVGNISRYSANHKIVNPGLLGDNAIGKTWSEALGEGDNIVKIAEYVYVFSPPQSACADPATAEGKKANESQALIVDEFQKSFSNLLPSGKW